VPGQKPKDCLQITGEKANRTFRPVDGRTDGRTDVQAEAETEARFLKATKARIV